MEKEAPPMEHAFDDNARALFLKEIEMVQACVTRMATNSFHIRGWYFSLLAGFVALSADRLSALLVAGLSIVLTAIFWYLDGFFLKVERLYRRKYNWLIAERPKGNKDCLFDLNPHNPQMWPEAEKTKLTSATAMVSRTLLPLYLVPTLIAFGVIVYQLT